MSNDDALPERTGGADGIYQHPLAYLLGLEGLALLRAFAGEYGEGFTLARIAEIRELLDRAEELGGGVHISPTDNDGVYASWADRYDSATNNMIRLEQPAMWSVFDTLPRGDVLDAACGTGRHAARLLQLGHRVVGVDSSAEMLAVARPKLPGADLRQGALEVLPVENQAVDAIVCGLALMHVRDLHRVIDEFARVLRPGGHVILSDWRSMSWNEPEPFVSMGEDGVSRYAPAWSRTTADYLRALLAVGFELRGIEEIPITEPLVDPSGIPTADLEADPLATAPVHRPGVAPNRWALHRYAPEAANAAYRGKPLVLILHLQLASSDQGSTHA